MIVEVRGIGFWTRVRLPPTPLNSQASNPSSNISFSAFKNVFAIIYELGSDCLQKGYPLTIGGIQRWISDEYNMEVSKSSICAVRDKCGVDRLEVGAAKSIPNLKSEKEKIVFEAFKAFGIV